MRIYSKQKSLTYCIGTGQELDLHVVHSVVNTEYHTVEEEHGILTYGSYTLHGTGTGTGTGKGMGTVENNGSLSLSLCSVYITYKCSIV